MQGLTGSPYRGQGAHGPLQGFGGSAPKVWPLTFGRRQKSQSGAEPNSQLPSLSEAPNRAAHKPQYIARFLLFQNPRFWNRRREADALHPRWEAKRPPTLPLTRKTGANGKAKGLTVSSFPTASGSLRERLAAQRSYRRPAALRDLRNVPFPKSTDSRGRQLWRRSCLPLPDSGYGSQALPLFWS